MKSIASRDNPLFKRWKTLATGTARRRSGRLLIEGPHLCRAWFERYGQPEVVLATANALRDTEVAGLWSRIDDARRVELAEPLFTALSEVVNGVAVAFEVAVPAAALPLTMTRDCVILDGLQDAGNVGSILRSAAAAGVERILCTPGTAQIWSPKVLRAGMGAHFQLQIHEGIDANEILARVRVPLLATSSHVSMAVYDTDLRAPCAWVFGNEGQGVSPALLQAARGICIPQPGGMESLNVAAAAAVCLFEMVRQRL